MFCSHNELIIVYQSEQMIILPTMNNEICMTELMHVGGL